MTSRQVGSTGSCVFQLQTEQRERSIDALPMQYDFEIRSAVEDLAHGVSASPSCCKAGNSLTPRCTGTLYPVV